MQPHMLYITPAILGRQPGRHPIQPQSAEAGIDRQHGVAAAPGEQIPLVAIDLVVAAKTTKCPHIVMQRQINPPLLPLIKDAVRTHGIPRLTAKAMSDSVIAKTLAEVHVEQAGIIKIRPATADLAL